jgi:hypothetical protein
MVVEIIDLILIVKLTACLEKAFDGGTDEENDGKDPKDGAEWLEQEDAASHHQAIEIAPAAAKKPAGHQRRQRPRNQPAIIRAAAQTQATKTPTLERIIKNQPSAGGGGEPPPEGGGAATSITPINR